MARDVASLLESPAAVVAGGRDRRGGPTMEVPANTARDTARPEDLLAVLTYLTSVPR